MRERSSSVDSGALRQPFEMKRQGAPFAKCLEAATDAIEGFPFLLHQFKDHL